MMQEIEPERVIECGKPRHDCFQLCHDAGQLLMSYGFRRKAISLKTEACYYFLPGREGVLRVAAHRSKMRWNGLDPVVARLTFSGRDHTGSVCLVCSHQAVAAMLYIAIGQYIANSKPCDGFTLLDRTGYPPFGPEWVGPRP